MSVSSLEITTALATKGKPCPNACSLCPQDTLKASYLGPETHFTLATLKKALETVPKIVHIHFSGFAEPFFNREAPEMIWWVQSQGWPVHLFTTLMGMPTDIGDRIRHTVPHDCASVWIHVPDQRAFTVNEDDWIKRHETFRALGLFSRYMAMGPISSKLSLYLTRLSLHVDLPAMRSRAGNLWPVKRIDGPIYCGDNRMHSNVLLPNGDVQLCCDDYSLKMKIGNLFFEPYPDVWKLAEEWRLNTNPPADSPCRTCEHGIKIQ